MVLDMTGLQKMQNFFREKCLKISQKLQGGNRKHIKVCKKTTQNKISKLMDELFFIPKPTSVVHISK